MKAPRPGRSKWGRLIIPGMVLGGLSLFGLQNFSNKIESPNLQSGLETTISARRVASEMPRLKDSGTLRREMASEIADDSRGKNETQDRVEAEPIALPYENEVPETLPQSLIIKDFWVWLGVGVNYTSSRQMVSGFSDIEFGRIKGPSTMAKAGFFVSDSIGLDLNYKGTPGEAKSSPNLDVRNGAYTWQSMSAEVLYRSERDLSRNSEWIWRIGFQQHQIPLIVPESSSLINLSEAGITNLSMGFEYKRKSREKLRFEWLMRYQRPIAQSSGDGAALSISPQFAFDGSIGSAYELQENLFLGVYWYGQYQKFDFSYHNDLGTNFSGNQNLFFSNFDLRLGWEF